MRRVLFVSAEVAPLVKVGGLADVVGSLPTALGAAGVEARVVIPKYGLLETAGLKSKPVVRGVVRWRGHDVAATIEETVLPQSATVLYLLDAPGVFSDGGVYYEHDPINGAQRAMERFLFFPWAVAHFVRRLPWAPAVVHCHDWHTATLPLFLRMTDHPLPTVLTIHNIEGQGKWNAGEVGRWIGPHSKHDPLLDVRDAGGNFNALQLGIRGADELNTVSPTYATELLQPEYGGGLDHDITQRSRQITGILNGIDLGRFNPATDRALAATYGTESIDLGKHVNKKALLNELDLGPGPLFGMVGRLTSQKGADLIIDCIPDVVQAGGRLVILGSGVPDVERAVTAAVERYPGHARAIVRFDAALAQRIYAASDFFLMPSRFEPCGLGQMIAMRYGALPIVRDTGGLHDTVRDVTSSDGTGIIFGPPTAGALREALRRALQLFTQPDMLQAARVRAMSEDFSWSRAARQYAELYAKSER